MGVAVKSYPLTMVVLIAKIVFYLSLFVQYGQGQAISASELSNLKAELKKEIFEDEKMTKLGTQLTDNIMATGEIVTALQHQEILMNATLNDYNELKEAQLAQERETNDLRLQFKTLEMYSKLTLPETCSALRKTGMNESVTAMINPAGVDEAFAPIEVRCDLPEDKTYLGKETKIEVRNCDTLACYNESIDYNASKEQIEALIYSSMSCRQVIKLECISAPIVDRVSIALLIWIRVTRI